MSWRITNTNYNLDNAEDLESWVIEKEKEVDHPIILRFWKRLDTEKPLSKQEQSIDSKLLNLIDEHILIPIHVDMSTMIYVKHMVYIINHAHMKELNN